MTQDEKDEKVEKKDETASTSNRIHDSLHEAAETDRQRIHEEAETGRARLANWRDTGFQWMVGVSICFVSLTIAITVILVAADFSPSQPPPPVKTPPPCTESVTQVNIATGAPVTCPVGAVMTFERGDPLTTAVIKCTCPKNTGDHDAGGSP